MDKKPLRKDDEVFKLVRQFLKKLYGESSQSQTGYVKSPVGFVLMVTGEDGDVNILGRGFVYPKHLRLLQSLMPTDCIIDEIPSKSMNSSEQQNN